MFQTKVVEEVKIRILCSTFFFLENRAAYKIIWKNLVQPDGPQKATNTHLECVTSIAFPLQQ